MSRNQKIITTIVSVLLLVTIFVGGTSAILIDGPKVIENVFNDSEVTTSVVETIDGTEKKNVSIQNTGDTKAYIRAAVVVTWKDDAGNIYGTQPVANSDYVILFNNNGWVKGVDGFYYWTLPVEPNETTGILIDSCTYLNNAPDNYSLNVEIIGSGIQSVPADAVTSAWSSGVSGVTGTTLNIKKASN